MKNQWVQAYLTDAKAALPFSFVYTGKGSASLLAEWPNKVQTAKIDADRTRHTLVWTDPQTALEVRCEAVEYADYPVVEWTVYFKNTGTNNTPILENIQGLDAPFDAGAKGDFVLHGIKGDFQSAESYEPYRLNLPSGSSTNFGPHGPIWAGNGPLYPLGSSLGMPGTGKPCDGPDGWPYFNLQTPGGGTIIVVGWPGQWAASFTRDAGTGLTVRASQELTRLYLKPGEEIRTPLMAMLFWQGDDVVESQNLWRRWYRAHNLPRIEGKPQPAITFFCGCGTEKERPIVQSWLDAGIHLDVFWRDAGGSRDDVWWTLSPDPLPYPWPGMYWMNSGTWEPDPKRYPEGFKPYSDWVRARGMQFMLWFEPERVGDPNSWLGKNHPEWLLPNDNMGAILNEGHPAARQWLTDHISGMIDSQGLDWYREDMNGGGPCPAWRKNDAPDRQGITENLYVQGHLAFWDELRRRYPHLRIDSCASGGRRNDLETMRRAVPLLRSDYTMLDSNMADKRAGVIEGNQCHTYGLSAWLPFHGSCVGTADPYEARSHYVPCFGAGLQLTPENQAAVRRVYDECRQVAPFVLEGDYYPLTRYSRESSDWIAWQFNRPEQSDGVVQAFRRAGAPVAELRFKLKGLEADAIYAVRDLDKTGSEKVSGRELMETGLLVKIPAKGSAVILYSHLSAVATTDVTHGEAPVTVRFDGTSSASASGKIVSYDWAFGDGASTRDVMATHTYEKPGIYTARLTVKNDQGRSVVGEVTVSVSPVDTVAPALVAVKPPVRADRLILTFSKPVQKADAEGTNNYAITPGVQVLAASLGADLRTVTLTTSPLASPLSPGGEYTLTVKNIRDCARKPNPIAADTRKAFRYSPLFARWKLDDGKGLVAADAGGGKLDGTLKGGATWTNVAGRKAVSLDGASGIVDTPTKLEDLAVPFTFTFWVNSAAEQVEYANILGNHTGPAGLVMQQDKKNNNLFGFGYGDGVKPYGPTGAVQLASNEWQHVAVVCSDGKSFFYVNGVEKSSGAGSGVFVPNLNMSFRLGQGYGSGRFFRGLLSDVRIYRMALTAAEVQKVMKE